MGKTPEDDNTSKNILEKLPAFADNFTQAITKIASYSVLFTLIAFAGMRAIYKYYSCAGIIIEFLNILRFIMVFIVIIDIIFNNTTLSKSIKDRSCKGNLESVFNFILIAIYIFFAIISMGYAISSVTSMKGGFNF